MGIKDNFSQAVKELWKKEGQDKKDDKQQKAAQPSELDKYLRDGEQGNAAASGLERNGDGIPLETPYYRSSAETQGSPAQQTQGGAQGAQTDRQAQPMREQAQPTNPMGAAQEPRAQADQPVSNEPPINQNVLNAQNASNRAEQQNAERSNASEAQQAYQNPQRDLSAPQNNQQSQYDQNIQSIRQNFGYNQQSGSDNYGGYNQGGYNQGSYNQGGYNQNGYGGYGGNPPTGGGYGNGGNMPMGAPNPNETDEVTVISKNTMIDGNIRSLANMQIDGSIKGNVETTRNIDMSGKVIGDVTCNNAGMVSAAMQGNISLKGRMRMDRDTILIGDLSSQYADINGRVRGKLDIVGKAELKRDAVVFGDINASTIAVTDGAIIQGYVNTTFLSKEDSRNVFPDAISIDSKEVKS